MDYEHCRKILRRYFSNITYIDDQFDTNLIEMRGEVIPDDGNDMPLDIGTGEISLEMGKEVGLEETIIQTEKRAQEQSAIALMDMLQKLGKEEFADINLIPVVYGETVSDQFIIEKIMEANLAVIDWDLGHGKKALPIIKDMLNRVAQLKVVVVYTKGYLEARKSAEELFDKIEYVKDEDHIMCFQCIEKSKSLVFIVDKQYLNIKNILDEVETIFIQENGIMPIAVLDIADRLQEKSGNIFGAFCKPFEDTYFMQMYYLEVADDEISNYLSDFIIKKIYSDVHVSGIIGQELLISKKNALIKVLESSEMEQVIHKCIDLLLSGISGKNAYLLELQKDIDVKVYRTIARSLKENKEISWNKIIKSFRPLLKQIKMKREEDELNEVFGNNNEEFKKTFNEVYKKIKKEILNSIDIELENYKKEVIPLFLQTLITQKDFLKSLPELVENLKFHKYGDVDLGHYLLDGIDKKSYEKSKFLMNKIHFGDILYDVESKDYLLCITPPCDAFRPQKVDYNYTFIKGNAINANQINKDLKENMHITVYPLKHQEEGDKKGINYIKWRLFDVVTFGLEDDIEYRKVSKYKRYYRLDEIYTRQIANKMISHFSRAGVDEVFVKNEKNLISVFT